MDYDSLSQNGLQKVINNAPALIQILDIQYKTKGESQFHVVQISDGFARLKKSCVMNGGEKLKVYDVIRTQQVSASIKDAKIMVLIEKFTLIRDDITVQIGHPINYSDWEKTKKNPDGDNTLPPRKPKNMKPPQQPVKQLPHPQNFKTNQLIPQFKPVANQENSKINFPSAQINRKVEENSNTTSNNFTSKNQPPKNNLIQKPAVNLPQKNENQLNQQKNNPPPLQQNNKNQPQIKPQIDRHDRTYTMIKELYQGIENWKIKVRVFFRTEVKNYVKKTNGQESQVFSFDACDNEGCIEISAFGQAAGNFGNVIDLDRVYEISGGKVSKDDVKNCLKIMLTEKSVINLLDDDLMILTAEDFCITPEKLLQADPGTEWNVIALIKDINPIVEFVSKNGKQCKKKEIYLCDPEAQIEVPLTLWFDKAQIQFEKIPYALQGITVGQFKDQKQFSTTLKFSHRPYKNHKYRKFVGNFQKMKLENPVFESSNRSRTNIEMFNFHLFKQSAQKLDNFNSLTIEKLCYLTHISLGKKNFYLSCPACRKKVIDEQNGVCISDKCGKPYQKGKYRYLLNISLADETQTIWVTAYDEAAEVMLTSEIDNHVLTADEFVKMSEDDFRLIMPQFLNRQIKVTVTAKKQTYQGQSRVKFGVNKAILKIDYAQESAILAKQIQLLKSSM